MVMLTDLLERKRALEEENTRIQRDLGLLRQIDELANQLSDTVPFVPTEPDIPAPPPHEGGAEVDVPVTRIEVEAATPGTQTEAPPAEPPKPPPPAPPSAPAPEPEAKVDSGRRKDGRPYASPASRAKVLGALEDGPLLMTQLADKAGMSSGTVWRTTKALEMDTKIVCVGHGGFLDRSPRWALKERKPEPPPPSARVRKVIENEAKRAAKKNGPTQPATHEGRILQLLVLHNTMKVPEMAAELSIPASTVGRLVGKLKDEGEVAMDDRGYVSRIAVFA